MNIHENDLWNAVRQSLNNAKGMYFDGCHKIYMAMDDEQVQKFSEYGYSYHKPDFDILKEWFEESCWLRFVNAVYTNHEDPNKGYVQLIPQFAFDEEDDEL